MESKHKCKLCFRNFANGKALGGHMRSHMMNLPVPPKPNESPPLAQLSFEADSASSPSSSSKSPSYGLRENPKRSSRFADPEFFDNDSVIVQDRESETESSKNMTRRRRSKRVRRQPNESSSTASDITSEEDIAFCLIMMSRDNNWKRQEQSHEEEEDRDGDEDEDDDEEDDEEDEDDESDDDEFEEVKLKSLKTSSSGLRGRYKCETCNKVFRSYQALGGHRASHKKIKMVNDELVAESQTNIVNNTTIVVAPLEKKTHECPVCSRVFASGQALGGHKRTHVIGSATVTVTAAATTTDTVKSSVKFGDSLIDLNLPAPMDDDDASLIEESAVSDAEFFKQR